MEHINYTQTRRNLAKFDNKVKEMTETISDQKILIARLRTRLNESQATNKALKNELAWQLGVKDIRIDNMIIFDMAYGIGKKYFPEISEEAVKSTSRKREIVEMRHVLMTVIQRHAKLGLKNVGRLFGGRDHSTVINATRKVQDLCDTEKGYLQRFAAIDNEFKTTYREYVNGGE